MKNYFEYMNPDTDIMVASSGDESIYQYGYLVSIQEKKICTQTWMRVDSSTGLVLERFVGEPNNFPVSFLRVKNFFRKESKSEK